MRSDSTVDSVLTSRLLPKDFKKLPCSRLLKAVQRRHEKQAVLKDVGRGLEAPSCTSQRKGDSTTSSSASGHQGAGMHAQPAGLARLCRGGIQRGAFFDAAAASARGCCRWFG
jgi:hypothetical protein